MMKSLNKTMENEIKCLKMEIQHCVVTAKQEMIHTYQSQYKHLQDF